MIMMATTTPPRESLDVLYVGRHVRVAADTEFAKPVYLVLAQLKNGCWQAIRTSRNMREALAFAEGYDAGGDAADGAAA